MNLNDIELGWLTKHLGHSEKIYKDFTESKCRCSVAQSGGRPPGDQDVASSIPAPVRQHYFMEIDHEIFS